MTEKIKMLWAYSPKETAAMIAVVIMCSAMMAALLGLMLWTEAPDRMEET